MPKHREMIQYSPDERGGGSRRAPVADEADAPRGPRMFEVDGEQVDESELIRGYKGTKATTERFQEVSKAEARIKEREALAERRLQEADDRERRMNASRDALLTPKAPAGPPRPGFRERIKEIDLVATEDASERIGAIWEEEMSAREAALDAKHALSLTALRGEIEGTVKKGVAAASAASNQAVTAERIMRQNNETLERVLAEDFAGVQLSKKERDAVDKKYRQKIGDDYGKWDPAASKWVSNDEAARDAAWSVPEVRERMLSAKTASARGDGLKARERGHYASDSTPGRTARPSSSDPDQALLQKAHDLREGVQSQRITEKQAGESLTYAESKRLIELRQQERRRLQAEHA